MRNQYSSRFLIPILVVMVCTIFNSCKNEVSKDPEVNSIRLLQMGVSIWDAIETRDGHLVGVGINIHSGQTQWDSIHIIKTDYKGKLIWKQTIRRVILVSSNTTPGIHLSELSNGNLIINAIEGQEFFTLSPDGEILVSGVRDVITNVASRIIEIDENTFSYSTNEQGNKWNGYLLSFDLDGSTRFVDTIYQDSVGGRIRDLQIMKRMGTGKAGLYSGSLGDHFGNFYGPMVLKTDDIGNIVKVQKFRKNDYSSSQPEILSSSSVLTSNLDQYLIHAVGSGDPYNGWQTFRVIKVDSTLNTTWEKDIQLPGAKINPTFMNKSLDDGLVVVGTIGNETPNSFLLKISPDGELQIAKRYDDIGYFWTVTQLKDGSFACFGVADGYGDFGDKGKQIMTLFRIGPSGTLY
jgi:hypothetical protein